MADGVVTGARVALETAGSPSDTVFPAELDAMVDRVLHRHLHPRWTR